VVPEVPVGIPRLEIERFRRRIAIGTIDKRNRNQKFLAATPHIPLYFINVPFTGSL
jgi:hypothetical protein